jgi:hypothetical protein
LIDDGFDAVLEVHVDGEEDIRAVFGGDGFATEEGEFDTAAIFFDEAFAWGAAEDVFAELFDAPDAAGVFFGGPEGEGEEGPNPDPPRSKASPQSNKGLPLTNSMTSMQGFSSI